MDIVKMKKLETNEKTCVREQEEKWRKEKLMKMI